MALPLFGPRLVPATMKVLILLALCIHGLSLASQKDEKRTRTNARGRSGGDAYLTDARLKAVVKQLSGEAQEAFRNTGMNIDETTEESDIGTHSPQPDEPDSPDKEQRILVDNSILSQVPPEVIRSFTPMDLQFIFSTSEFSTRTISYYLANVESPVFLALVSNGTREPGFAPLATKTAIVEAATGHLGPVSSWTTDDIAQLQYAVCGFSGHHLKDTTVETFRRVLHYLRDCQMVGALDERLGHDIMREVESHWGRIATWSLQDLVHIKPFLKYLRQRQWEEIPTEIILSNVSFFGSLDLRMQEGRVIIDKLLSANWNWSGEGIQKIGLLAKHLTFKELNMISEENTLSEEALKSITDNIRGKRQTKQLAKMITASHGEASTWNSQTLRSLGSAARGLDADELDDIPDSSVRDAISEIANTDFSPKQRRIIMKKYRRSRGENGTRLTGSDLRELQGLVTGISSDDFKKMRPEDVRGAVDVLAKNARKMKPTQKRQILKSLTNSTDGLGEAVAALGEIASELPLKILENPDVVENLFEVSNNSDTDVQVLNAGRMNWTRRQSTKLVKTYMKNVDAEEMTASTLRSMGTLVTGIQCADIERLPEDDILGLVGAMMEQDGWNGRQLRCSAHKLRRAFAGDTNTTDTPFFTSDFDESDLESVTGRMLKHFTIEELDAIPHEYCETAVALIGIDEDVIELRQEKRQALAKLAMRCWGNGSAFDGSAMTFDQLTALGHLKCDLGSDALTDIPDDVISGFISDFQECCLDEGQMQALRQRILQNLGEPNTWTSDDLLNIGILVTTLTQEEIDQIDVMEFSDVVEDVVETLQEVKEMRAEYCDHDLAETDRSAFKDGLTRLAFKLKDSLVLSAQEEEEEESKRKKRSAGSVPTCSEIESLGEANIAWTVDELLSISNETIDNCIYTLGLVEGFYPNQSQAIMQRVRQAWGSPDEMEPSEIMHLGRLAGQFTPSEISQLNLSDVDTIWSIASFDVWTPEQLTAGANRVSDLMGIPFSDMDGILLTSFSNFLCGLTPSELSNLSLSAYVEAAAPIGMLTTCNVQQWSALKDLAVQEFGSIESWTVDVYYEIGGIVAGFTVAELQSITNETVAGVAPHAISLISGENFVSGLSPSALAAFDSHQVAAITEDQIAAMSTDHLYAMAVAIYGENEIPDEVLRSIYEATATTTQIPPTVGRQTTQKTKKSGSSQLLASSLLVHLCLPLVALTTQYPVL